jgi:hypothetical protein
MEKVNVMSCVDLLVLNVEEFPCGLCQKNVQRTGCHVAQARPKRDF